MDARNFDRGMEDSLRFLLQNGPEVSEDRRKCAD